jgi:hypothetical protein
MAEGRKYSVPFTGVTWTNTCEVFTVTPADDKPVKLLGFQLDNVNLAADAGDAQEETIQWQVSRGAVGVSSGGTAPTPQPIGSSADAASGFTARVNDTTLSTSTNSAVIFSGGWNIRVPLREFWPEEIWPGASQADTTIKVRLGGNTDAVVISGTLFVVEQG